MRIQCEYCGAFIDVRKDDACPNCGATFDKNSRLHQIMQAEKENAEIQKEETKLRLEGQRLQNERTRIENEIRRQKATAGNPQVKQKKFVSGIIVLIAAGIFLSVCARVFSGTTEVMENHIPPVTEASVVEVPVEVSFGEKASTSTYSVVCDAVEEYDYPWESPQEGYQYVGIHFIVTNISEKEILSDEPVLCSYKNGDYLVQAENPTIRTEDLDTKLRKAYIAPAYSIMGKVYFTVPEDTDLIVKYGDYITIHIPAGTCADLPE